MPADKTKPTSEPVLTDHDLAQILRASRDKLKAVFDTMADPMVSLTPEMAVQSINQSMAAILGKHPRDLVGRKIYDLLGPVWSEPRVLEPIKDAVWRAAGRLNRQQVLVKRDHDGETRHWEVTVSPVLGEGGKLSLLVVHFRDVTEFKRMEATILRYSQDLENMVAERTRDLVAAQDQLRADKDRLEAAYQRLRQLEQLRHDLTAMVVHDLKGPLAEVLGNLDLIRYDPLNESQLEYLSLAEMGAEDLLRMIMNLLEIDRMEEGRLELRYSEAPFGPLAEAVRAKFRTIIDLKDLTCRVDDRLERPLWVDPEIFDRVLQNLLTNAINYTPEGGSIDLYAEAQGKGARIAVKDNGQGIPPEYQERIFEKFAQASDGRGPRTSTGLGLTFCKLAVKAHGGAMSLQSQVGQGTTFFIDLPPRPVED